MTDKELRKLSRKELLELLVIQGRENEALKKELKETKAALEDKKICISEAGSIAEAALKLNKVFEAAQAAACQYIENIEEHGQMKSRVKDAFKELPREENES